MHNKPHTEEAKAKMRAARAKAPKKWGWLPGAEIAGRLLRTDATTRSIAVEYGCSSSTIRCIFRRHTTKDQRLVAKRRKQGESIRGRKNPGFALWRRTHDVWSGRRHSEEAKAKQSAAKLGKKQSLERRIAQSAKSQGITIEEWAGFACSRSERLKRSREYREWRNSVFARDDWTCQECGVRGGTLHPHHIKSKATHPEIMFDVDNGLTLCAGCHRTTDSYAKNAKRPI